MRSNKHLTLPVIICILLLTACSSQQISNSKQIQEYSAQTAASVTFTPEQAIKKAEQKLLEAKSAALDFYAPVHLLQAQESITQAREYLTNPPTEIRNASLMAAIAAQKYIEDAYKNKEAVESVLNRALTHKKMLEDLNTPTLLVEDYESVINDLSELIKQIELGEIAAAVDEQADILLSMSELEVSTLKITHLAEAERYFEKAEDINASKYAKSSYDNAEKVLKASNEFIQK